MGLALGVVSLGVMALLMYFIHNNVRMRRVIAAQKARVADSMAQLTQKTQDLDAVLQNVSAGVLTVVREDLVNPDFVESAFGKSNLGEDAKAQIATALAAVLGEDAALFDSNEHWLAREMRLQVESGVSRIVHLHWRPMVNAQGRVERVLLITQDVTHLRELEHAVAKQRDELDLIAKIVRIPVGKFNDFVESGSSLIATNREMVEANDTREPEVIEALMRNIHTLKDNARTFEFTHIANAAQRAAHTYEKLRKNADAHWDPELLQTELDVVESALGRYITVNEDRLVRKGRASDLLTTRGVFVSNQQLQELRALASGTVSTHADADATRIRDTINTLGYIPLERLVSGSVDSLSSLANELKKPPPMADIANGEFSFNVPFAEALKSSLMLILRDCLDHGIESPDERLQAHKPLQGKVRFTCTCQGEQLQLHVSDDGRGLALHELHEKGLSAGVFRAGEQPSREAIAEMIFRQDSGRGVGMEAARTFLAEQGASVRIALSQVGKELGFTPFELVIDIPPEAYRHAA